MVLFDLLVTVVLPGFFILSCETVSADDRFETTTSLPGCSNLLFAVEVLPEAVASILPDRPLAEPLLFPTIIGALFSLSSTFPERPPLDLGNVVPELPDPLGPYTTAGPVA